MLEIANLGASYGQFRALFGVDLRVGSGEAVALLGSNGAGKSTTLRCVTGLLPVTQGSITFEGKQINDWSARDVVRSGLIMVPEGRQVFPFLSVLENLELGSFLPESRRLRSESLEHVYSLLPRLKERSEQLAGTLSGGEQQMLAIGRALMARPRLLVLDEPSLGLAPIIVTQIFDLLRQLRAEGMTLLLVEQNAALALDFVDRAYIIDAGKSVMSGPAAQIRDDPMLKATYLGGVASD